MQLHHHINVNHPAFFIIKTTTKTAVLIMVVTVATTMIKHAKNHSRMYHLNPNRVVRTFKDACLIWSWSLLSRNSIVSRPKSLLSNFSNILISIKSAKKFVGSKYWLKGTFKSISLAAYLR